MFAAIMAYGGNDLLIPAMVFPDVATAEQFVQDLVKQFPNVLIPTSRKNVWNVREIACDDDDENYDKTGTNGCMLKLFKRYYDGCGGVSSIDIRELKFGTPLVNWDLD